LGSPKAVSNQKTSSVALYQFVIDSLHESCYSGLI
jgi:hypothetical protein